ncbi:MAG: hypothetical protein WCW36_03155 [Candidatus Paceibacterota bacterium]|jgi:hypothetical protein
MSHTPEFPKEPCKKIGPEEHKVYPVTRDEHGDIHGLPEGKSAKDVIVFQGNDKLWYAQDPEESPEIVDDIKAWREDWQDIKE